MMKKLSFEKILGILMLIFAIGFNLWLYRLEPTATVDPNDNAFQFGLVDRTNTMWDFATKKCFDQRPISLWLTSPVCHFLYLADHWVPNWADGFNLPYYYSHVPQIVIVGSWRIVKLFTPTVTLFHFYHIVIYLLLCFFPLSVFLALRIMGLSWLTAGIGALFATNLSTDGLYGLDPSSFLWRGYGLSSQLFAMAWFPLAIAYSYRFFSMDHVQEDGKQFLRELASQIRWFLSKRHSEGHHLEREEVRQSQENGGRETRKNSFLSFLLPAVFFTTATTAGHLGIGMIAMLTLGFLAATAPIMKILRQEPIREVLDSAKDQFIRLSLVAGISIFLLSYWIVPTFIDGNYHNISYWDPVWKFNSYGVKETIIRLFNGDLFDFGRLPVITYLTLLGVIVGLTNRIMDSVSGIMDKTKNDDQKTIIHNTPTISPLSFLFIFWLVFYFGRTTWGALIDIIPGMKDFHLSRFIVGVHLAGMLLAPIGFTYLVSGITNYVLWLKTHKKFAIIPNTPTIIRYTITGIAILVLLPPVFRWTIKYNELNNRLIIQANNNHAAVRADEQKLFAKLRSLPAARIFAGRGGGYGKEFRVAETPYYMQLSTFGLPTTLWLPETWSMNSDTEQFFSEDRQKDYDLYNIRWVAAPPDQATQSFWKLIDQTTTWKLYEVTTSGYFATGVRAATVSITKLNFVNLVHLWIQSDTSKNGIYPELTFDKSYPKTYGLPNFKMTDEADYITPDGKTHSLFNEPPAYFPPGVTSIEQLNKLTKQSPEEGSGSARQYLPMTIIGPETDDTDMIFSTKVEVGNNCKECLVILKQTFHPNWKATVNGKPVKPIIVFPFYPAVQITAPGTYTVVFSYTPSSLKTLLLYLAFIVSIAFAGMQLSRWHTKTK